MEITITKAWENTSIFQDVVEFEDLEGNEYRFMWQGCNTWHVYVKDETVFIMRGVVNCGRRSTCYRLFCEFEESQE